MRTLHYCLFTLLYYLYAVCILGSCYNFSVHCTITKSILILIPVLRVCSACVCVCACGCACSVPVHIGSLNFFFDLNV